MKSGYKILWTDQAIYELKETVEYLENNWTEKELRKFAAKLDHTIELISKMPEIFPESVEKSIFEKLLLRSITIFIIESIKIQLKLFLCLQIERIRLRKKYKTVAQQWL